MSNDSVTSEADLVRRFRAGDGAAFQALCARYSATLLARIESRLAPGLRRKLGASDILQDAYIVALGRVATFEDRGEGSFGHWLGRIVELKVREAVRRHTRGKRAVGREVPPVEGCDPPGRDPTPSAAAVAGETERRARAIIASLPDDHREALRLIQEQQLSPEDAARRMGRTPQAVQKLYERALAALGARLGITQRERGR